MKEKMENGGYVRIRKRTKGGGKGRKKTGLRRQREARKEIGRMRRNEDKDKPEVRGERELNGKRKEELYKRTRN